MPTTEPNQTLQQPKFIGYQTAIALLVPSESGVPHIYHRHHKECGFAVQIDYPFQLGMVPGASNGPSGDAGDWIFRSCGTGHLMIISDAAFRSSYTASIGEISQDKEAQNQW